MNEFRKGWSQLVGSFIGISAGVSSIYFYSLGLFLEPVSESFGWTHGQASLGPLAGTLGAAIASIPTGKLLDRVGARSMAIASMLLLAAGFASLAFFTHGLASFLLITALLSLLTVGSTPLSYTRLIIGGFEKQRGLALGLTLAATGVGAMITPPLLGPFIAAHGWRAGYSVLAGIVLVCTIPVAILIPRSGPRIDARPAPAIKLAEFVLTRHFVLLGAIFFLASSGILGGVVQLPAMLSDFGVPVSAVGSIAGTVGLAIILGRALSGVLLDRLPAYVVASVFFGISALGLLVLASEHAAYAQVSAFALGLSVGAEADLLAFLVAALFPKAAYGSIYGSIYALFLGGVAIGPALVGFGFDLAGSYTPPLLLLSALVFAAALLALAIPRPTPVSDPSLAQA